MKDLKHIKTDKGDIWYGKIIHKFEEDTLSKKQIERRTVDMILAFINKDEVYEISRDSLGKPFFSNNPSLNVSISHSNAWYAIYLSKIDQIGIDIQTPKQKIIRGKDYFINADENILFDSLNNQEAHIIWCAKEAFYKFKGGKIDDLKEDVTICTIDLINKEGNLKYKDESFSFFIILEAAFYLASV